MSAVIKPTVKACRFSTKENSKQTNRGTLCSVQSFATLKSFFVVIIALLGLFWQCVGPLISYLVQTEQVTIFGNHLDAFMIVVNKQCQVNL